MSNASNKYVVYEQPIKASLMELLKKAHRLQTIAIQFKTADKSEHDQIVNTLAECYTALPVSFFFLELVIQIHSNQDTVEEVRKKLDGVVVKEYCPASIRKHFWDSIVFGRSFKSRVDTSDECDFDRFWDRYISSSATTEIPAWKLDLIKSKHDKSNNPPKVEDKPVVAQTPTPTPPAKPVSPFDGVHNIPIDELPWETTKSIIDIAGGLGSSGVFIVIFDNNGAVALKPGSSSNLCAEVFGTLFMQHVGLAAPACRIPTQAETASMKLGKESLYLRPEAKSVMYTRLRKGGGVWLLMEFMVGSKLYGLSPEQRDLPNLLKQLGEIAAADAVLNNHDRLPVVHRNTGNIDNWIINADGVVHPIDQAVSAIKIEAGQIAYWEKVKEFAAEVHSGRSGACYKRLKQHLEDNAGVTIQESDFVYFAAGVETMIKKIDSLDEAVYSTLRDEVSAMFLANGQLFNLEEHLTAIDVKFLVANSKALCS